MNDLLSIGVELEPSAEPAPTALAPIVATVSGLDLGALLTFLPDVKLKDDLRQAADAALAIDLAVPGNLQKADAALVQVREKVAHILLCFDGSKDNPGPTALAGALHKRLTGLRGDFVKAGTDAIEKVGKGIVAEQRRQADEAEAARRAAQAEADRIAREQAKAAAEQAKRDGAPKGVVRDLNQLARSATAPAVHVPGPPVLANSTTARKWKARLRGTTEQDETNPETPGDMTQAQVDSFRRLVAAVAAGHEPIASLCPNWRALNDRADGERTTMMVDGVEAYEDIGFRAKPRRR